MFDVAAPIVVYYVLRGEGASYQLALLAGAVLLAVGSLVTLISQRRVDPVATLMVVSMLSALVGSLIAGSPRFLLARDGLMTGVWGVWFLVSARGRRPAALLFARPLMENMRLLAGRSWDVLWATEPQFRRIWRASTVMWGLGLLLDAAIRVAISYTLPVNEVPALGGALYPVTFVALQVITNVYYMRAGLYRILGARWLDRPRHGGTVTGTPDLATPELSSVAGAEGEFHVDSPSRTRSQQLSHANRDARRRRRRAGRDCRLGDHPGGRRPERAGLAQGRSATSASLRCCSLACWPLWRRSRPARWPSARSRDLVACGLGQRRSCWCCRWLGRLVQRPPSPRSCH